MDTHGQGDGTWCRTIRLTAKQHACNVFVIIEKNPVILVILVPGGPDRVLGDTIEVSQTNNQIVIGNQTTDHREALIDLGFEIILIYLEMDQIRRWIRRRAAHTKRHRRRRMTIESGQDHRARNLQCLSCP